MASCNKLFLHAWRNGKWDCERLFLRYTRLDVLALPRRYLTQKQMRSPKYRTRIAMENINRDITATQKLPEKLIPGSADPVSTMPGFPMWYKIFTEITNGTDTYLSVEDWDRMEKTYTFEEKARMDVVLGSLMNLTTSYNYQKLGKSIVDYFKAKNIPTPFAVAARYVKLCGKIEGPEMESKVLDAYGELKKMSRLGIFDATTAETVIDALYKTSQWKECLRLVEMIQIMGKVGPGAYSKVIAGAFLHNDPETAWKFINLQQAARHPLMPVALVAWYDYACGIGQAEVLKMLEISRAAEWYVPLEVAEKLKTRMELQTNALREKWRGRFTTVSLKGECKACGAYLEPITITKDEFTKLRDNFIQLVVESSDVFLRSNPREVVEFRQFVEKNAPFDLVIDGLNVAYFQTDQGNLTPRKLAHRLRVVVEYVTTRNVGPKKVLILGRKHMRSWPSDEMSRINRAAKLFYAENISQDDPFLLYAALYSGQQCDFMSGDLMRDHRFKLGTKESEDALKKIFLKWQRTHQLQVMKVYPDGTVKLKAPMRFDTVVQWTDDSMHVPYESGIPRGLHEVPGNWLCLTKGAADKTRI